MPEGNALLAVPSQAHGWRVQKCSTSCTAASVMLSGLPAESSTITSSVTVRVRLQPHEFSSQCVQCKLCLPILMLSQRHQAPDTIFIFVPPEKKELALGWKKPLHQSTVFKLNNRVRPGKPEQEQFGGLQPLVSLAIAEQRICGAQKHFCECRICYKCILYKTCQNAIIMHGQTESIN